jgi:hypothetical protein
MTPLTGWLAGRFGIKYVFLISVAGFTLASALCGSATSLAQLVIYLCCRASAAPPSCRCRNPCCCRSTRRSGMRGRWRFGVPEPDRPCQHEVDHPDRTWPDCGLAVADDQVFAADGDGPVISTGVLQGFGLGFVFTPLSTVTFSTSPRQILTQGTAIFSLTRNIGGSVGIAVVEALLAENTQIVHSRLVENLRPDNPLAQAP